MSPFGPSDPVDNIFSSRWASMTPEEKILYTNIGRISDTDK